MHASGLRSVSSGAASASGDKPPGHGEEGRGEDAIMGEKKKWEKKKLSQYKRNRKDNTNIRR